MTKPIVSFQRDYSPNELWWCNVHQRRAEYIKIKSQHIRDDTHQIDIDHCCDPKLGGIMIPCKCLNLTGEVEIENGK